MYHGFELKVTSRMQLVEQELLILLQKLSSSPFYFYGFHIAQFLIFCVGFRISLFVLFPLAIVLSDLPLFTSSDDPHGIFSRFFNYCLVIEQI